MKIILGAGSLASEVYCYLRETHAEVDLCFYSEIGEDRFLDRPVYHRASEVPEGAEAVIGVGNPELQQKLAESVGLKGYTHVSRHAHIADVTGRSTIGEGTIVTPGCILTTDIHIGRFCCINLDTTIGHNTAIDDYCNIAPGVHLSGNIVLGKRCNIGTGSVIKERVKICEDVVIGMGAAVVKDIEEPGVYVGCPAKKIR